MCHHVQLMGILIEREMKEDTATSMRHSINLHKQILAPKKYVESWENGEEINESIIPEESCNALLLLHVCVVIDNKPGNISF